MKAQGQQHLINTCEIVSFQVFNNKILFDEFQSGFALQGQITTDQRIYRLR